MTAIIILLVLILLCMFKTVRLFIGILFILVWWNWPQTNKIAAQEPPATVIEQPVVLEQPQPEPQPSEPRTRKPQPYIQQ